jgi:hypothetical protein
MAKQRLECSTTVWPTKGLWREYFCLKGLQKKIARGIFFRQYLGWSRQRVTYTSSTAYIHLEPCRWHFILLILLISLIYYYIHKLLIYIIQLYNSFFFFVLMLHVNFTCFMYIYDIFLCEGGDLRPWLAGFLLSSSCAVAWWWQKQFCLRMGTELVPETLYSNELTRLCARENYIEQKQLFGHMTLT